MTPALGDVRGLTWSPDGERIAFVRSGVEDGLGDLWVIDADGGSPTLLAAGRFGWPSWSPEGTRMATVTSSGAAGMPGIDIGVLDLESGLVTDLGRGGVVPTWTGDGSQVVTSIQGTAGPATVTIDPLDGTRTVLVSVAGGRPSPDGRWVVYPAAP